MSEFTKNYIDYGWAGKAIPEWNNTMNQTQLPTIEEQEQGQGQETAFMVNDAQSAAWVLRKIAARQAEIDLVKAQAAEMVRSLQSGLDSFKARFEPQLEAWAREHLQMTGGKSKTVKTLGGNLSFRTVPAALEIADTGSAAETALLLGLVKPAPVDLVAYRKAAQEALETRGELLPGVEIRPERESFSIRFPKEGPAEE